MSKRTSTIATAAERAFDRVQRAAAQSRQPRFAPDARRFFAAVFGWIQTADDDEPDYRSDSRARDDWLRAYWRQEPHLAGVINSVVSIDKNRGWSMVGGRNQVRRFTRVAHNYHVAPALRGWRPGIGATSLSFYTADINALVELWRDGAGGPLAALNHLDPARCRLTGDPDEPLLYQPIGGESQRWSENDFFRVSALASTDEALNGLGWCAVSRCLELAKIMVAVYQHDQEMLGAKAPKGLLLLKGISEGQWNDAMEARDVRLTAKERQYYGGVEVLATEGFDDIDAKLVALSQLPTGFDLQQFTNLLMYGYALAFGYDASEFYPVQFGSLGRGTETDIQHRKATGKGGLDFVLAFQEQFQERLPPTVLFEFEQRDTEGELIEAEVAQAWADLSRTLYESGEMSGERLLTREEARSMLAEQGVIPREWTEIEEDAEATDTEGTERRRLEGLARVRRAAERYQAEPIIRYRWPGNREEMLWPSGAALLARQVWPAPYVQRQTDGDEVLYADPDGDFTITQADVDRAIEQAGRRVDPELAELLNAETVE